MTQDTGTVGEEAAKLFEALGAWARGAAAGRGAPDGERPGAGGWSPADLEAMLRQLTDHVNAGVSDGSPACRLCPVCQLIAVLRQTRPETFAHLLDASAALTAALRSVVDASGGGNGRASGVQKIDLDPPGPAASTA